MSGSINVFFGSLLSLHIFGLNIPIFRKMSEQNFETILTKVKDQYKEMDYQGIIDYLPENVLEENKKAELYAWKGRAYYRLEKADEAIDYAEKAIKIDKKLALGYLVRAVGKSIKKDWKSALNDYGKAIELDQNNSNAYINRGIVWRNKGELDKALIDHNKAIELAPKNAEAYLNRGLVWQRKREWEKALADFDEAEDLDEHSSHFLFQNKGHLYFEWGKWDLALENYKKAKEAKIDLYGTSLDSRIAECNEIIEEEKEFDEISVPEPFKVEAKKLKIDLFKEIRNFKNILLLKLD